MPLITIPFDYIEGESAVVPICIRSEDPAGNRIVDGWIQGVVRAADGLRRLAKNILEDEWRVSELTDETVQDLWRIHRTDVGKRPHSRIYVHAKWKALDKQVGGVRARRGLDVELLDQIFCTLHEPSDFVADIERREFLDRLQERLLRLELTDVNEMLDLALQDCDVDFTERFGKQRNTLSKQFWRGIRKAIHLL